jgi:raffinose/stachyose/melibiose transport system substrate-binding protein
MKMKQIAVITGLIFLIIAGCSKAKPAGGASVQQVILYNNKIEIVNALEAMTVEYNAAHPKVKLVINTTGSDSYTAELKSRFAGGEAPDIFVVTGTEQMLLYMEYLEDLSGQPWVADMVDIAKPNISYQGKIFGFPVGIEGYGYMYNKDAFAKAGIEKVPLSLQELAAAAEKLRAAGFTPFVNTFGEWYQSGMFYFSAALAHQKDPFAFIEGLNKGTETIIGNPAFIGLANMITIDYSGCESPLNTDFSAQVSRFASAQAAIATGGTWNQPTLDDAKPGMNAGLMPMPFMPNPAENDVLYAGVTNYWAVNKNSAAKEAAKEFLAWLVSDAAGRRYLTTEMVNIPAFKSVSADNKVIGPLGQSLAEYLAAGKTLGIYNSRYPFSATQEFGTSIQKYAAGRINQQQLLQEFQAIWDANKTQ